MTKPKDRINGLPVDPARDCCYLDSPKPCKSGVRKDFRHKAQ